MPAFAGIDWVWQHYAVCIVDGVGGRLEGGDGHAFEVWVDRDLDTAASTRDEQRSASSAVTAPRSSICSATGSRSWRSRPAGPIAARPLRDGGEQGRPVDAFVLADALRTGAKHWTMVRPDSEETIALRMMARTRQDLVRHRIAVHSTLLTLLQHCFPERCGSPALRLDESLPPHQTARPETRPLRLARSARRASSTTRPSDR